MRIQLAGFDQGVAARAGGDVARAGERGDPVGLGLALTRVVDAARRSVVGSPIGLDGGAVGGESFGVGGVLIPIRRPCQRIRLGGLREEDADDDED